MDPFVPLYVIIPLAAAFLIPLIGRFLGFFQKFVSSLSFLFLTVISVMYLVSGGNEGIIYKVGGWQPVDNIPIAIYMVLDKYSAILLVITNLIAFLTTFYSFSYIKKFTSEDHYFVLLCLMIAGMNGVILAGDLFNLYVFLEIASIASYALVAFAVEKEELEASFKYQVLGGMASLFILLAIGLLYWTTSTLNIADIARILENYPDNKIIIFIQVLLLTGFGLKAAIVPFHAWLPDAHSSAPSPISSILSGVFIKAVGLYVLIRLFFNMFAVSYEMGLIITILGVLSMLVGGILATGQRDYKRLLAYSSISQIGYVLLGIGVGMLIMAQNGDMEIAALAIFGALFHLINHAVFKGLLFMTAGAVEYATNIREFRKLGGLSRVMPLTSTTSLTGSLAISGIPPLNGFFSKLIIIIAVIQAQYYLLAFIAIIVSIITIAYFLKYQKDIFSGDLKRFNEKIREVPYSMRFSMIVLAFLCIALSLLVIPDIREVVLTPAVNILLGTSGYSLTILGM